MTRGANPILRLESVHRNLGGQPILRGIDLTLASGEIAVLIGGSGSGKTTLLRIVAGLERVDSGRVALRGTDVDGPGTRRFIPPERRSLGMVFQEAALWPHLTVQENVAIAAGRDTGPAAKEALRLLEVVGLGSLAARLPDTLSGGQKQRVALARALATGSDLLLLDEPLSSLDEMVRDRLRPLIRDTLRSQQRSALFVSHDRMDAWRLADRILVLENGRLSQADTPEALYRAPATPTVARYMGATGSFPVRGAGSGRIVTPGGRIVGAKCVDLACGGPGVAMAYPDALSFASDGIPASRIDSIFEAGRWRTRWRLAEFPGEMHGLHDHLPPDHALVQIDPAKLFVFPVATSVG